VGSAFISALADQITKVEGTYPPGTPGYPQGSIAWRDNNPGNLRSAPSSFCQINPPAVAGYADFCDAATGRAAEIYDVTAKINRGLNLTQFLNIYAPAGDGNDPTSYTATVAAGLGIDPSVPLINYVNGSAAPGDSSGSVSAPQDVVSDSPEDTSSDLPAFSLPSLPASISPADLGSWFSSLDPVTSGALLGAGALLLVAILE
jgi:hypothetical protein